MTLDIFQTVWPLLLLLAYLLFTCVLAILANQHAQGTGLHDRIRESKTLRRQYLQANANKKVHG